MDRDDSPEPGETVAGRYDVRKEIGSGGYSTVLRARDRTLGRDLALKVLDFDADELQSVDFDRQRRERRFRREAKLLARLDHPSTVTLHDFGRTRNGDIYMALEYVEGTPLHRGPDRPVSPNRLVRWLRQAAESLSEAHSYGILHRDIKPSNVILSERPGGGDRLKLIDFGVAKPLRNSGLDTDTFRTLTAESEVVGTPRYLPPEYVTDESPGPASDLYSLGLLAHELLLDREPVPGEDPMSMIGYHVSEQFRVAIPSVPSVPEHLRQLVNRMTAHRVDERYDDADQLREDLAALPDFSEIRSEAPWERPDRTSRISGISGPEAGGDSTARRRPAERPGDETVRAKPSTEPYSARTTAPVFAPNFVDGEAPRSDRERNPTRPRPTLAGADRPRAGERLRPSRRPGEVVADDSIHSDGPALGDGERGSLPPGDEEPRTERRTTVALEPLRTDGRGFRGLADWMPSDWFLAAFAGICAAAACWVAVVAF